ncbi:MAG: glycosyltransferase family 39 protein [Candidatus Omnitrophica bacterium]|nr:glycosyltransferase family 39 protein [Candidatus Omnitrophota bacterium]
MKKSNIIKTPTIVKPNWLAMASFFLFITLLTFSNVFGHKFTLDDKLFFAEKGVLQSLSIVKIFTSSYIGFYRPLGMYVYGLEMQWFGTHLWAYHLVSVLFFTFIGYLLYVLVWLLWGDRRLAFWSALLYLVHPINHVLVDYKTAVTVMVSVAAMQISFIFFIWYLRGEKLRDLCGMTLFFTAALFSHEMSFLLPGLFLILWCLEKKFYWKEFLKIFVPLFLVFCLFFFARMKFVGISKEGLNFAAYGLGFFQYFNTFFDLVKWYLSKLIWPEKVVFLWNERITQNNFDLARLLWTGGLGIIVTVIFVTRKKLPAVFKSLVWFWLGMIPAFLGCFVYSRTVAYALIEPHWFSFWGMGFFIFIALIFVKIERLLGKWGTTVGVLVVSGLAGLTFLVNANWADDLTYSKFWLDQNSINGSAWQTLSRGYIEKYDQGVDASKYDSCEVPAYLGLAYQGIEKINQMQAYYDLALKIDPKCAQAYYGLSILWHMLKDNNKSADLLYKAKELDVRYFRAYQIAVTVFDTKQDKDSYIQLLEEYKKIKGTEAVARWLEK